MQHLTGVINVINATGSTALTLDDSQDTTGQTATLTDNGTSGSVTGLSPALITYTDADISSLTVDGGSGGNTFTVHGTLTNPSFPATLTTLNTGTGDNTVNVEATNAHSLLAIQGQGGFDTVDVGLGTLSVILGAITIDNVTPGLDDLTIDGSTDPLSHTFDLSSSGVTSTLVDALGNMPGHITYTTTSLDTLTIDAGPAGGQALNIDFSGGNPIPIPTTSGVPGLTFNAGSDATSAANSHAMNLSGTLPSGAFASEIHNANDPAVPALGQYGSIDFTDSTGIHTSLWYTGLQPINDTTPATNYTFNDLADDQSFTALDGPVLPGPLDTIQFVNTPALPPPTFETTNVANKTNIVFNTPPFAGTPLAITGVINIPTASTGLASLTFNTDNNGDKTINIDNTPNGIATNVNGQGGLDTINVNSTGTSGTLNVSTGPVSGGTVNVVADNQPVNITLGAADFVNIGSTGAPARWRASWARSASPARLTSTLWPSTTRTTRTAEPGRSTTMTA